MTLTTATKWYPWRHHTVHSNVVSYNTQLCLPYMDVMSRFCFLFFIFNVSYYKKCEWKYSYTSHQLVFCDTCITDSNSKTRQNTNTPTSSCWLCVFVTVHPPMILELWKLDPLYSVEMQLPLGGLERWPLPTVHDCRSWRLLRPECLADACTMNALSSYMTLNIHKILQHCAHYPSVNKSMIRWPSNLLTWFGTCRTRSSVRWRRWRWSTQPHRPDRLDIITWYQTSHNHHRHQVHRCHTNQ